MLQTKRGISLGQKEIRQFFGNKETMTNMKIKKSDVTGTFKDGIVPPGTPITKDGKLAKGADTFGILFAELDVRGIQDGETAQASVLIDGFVNKERIEEYTGKEVATEVIEALKGRVQFL